MLQNMLSKFVQENKEIWDGFLDTCTFVYNTSHHESTLHTPFEVMFGRQAVLPIDLDMEKQSPEQLLQEYKDASADQPEKEIAAITAPLSGTLSTSEKQHCQGAEETEGAV